MLSMYRPTVASQEMAGLKVVEPRMAMVAPVVLDGERVILTLGTEVPRSSMLLTPFCSRVSASKAAMEMGVRSEEHTSELQSRGHLVCRLLLEKKKARRLARMTHRHTDAR